MNNYQDYRGMFHDKPAKDDGEPSSNNGWIYSAYAAALGLKVPDLKTLAYDCVKNHHSDSRYAFRVIRLPGLPYPPMSRDEIIGVFSLFKDHWSKKAIASGIFNKDYSWYKEEVVGKHSLIDSISAVWGLRDKHRNHVWKQKIYAAYPIVFKLAPHDRYYIKMRLNKTPTLLEFILFQIYCFSTIVQKNYSARNILWLQLHDLKSMFWIKLINKKSNFLNYFGKEHIFITEKQGV